MDFQKMCIVGTGLIGASLALACKRKNICPEIIGVDEHEIIEKAVAMGVIDSGYEISSIDKAVAAADLVVLATPIKQILKYISIIPKLIKKGALVTDVGSSKSHIVKLAASKFNNGTYFIGGHPMAGSEKRGLMAADSFLFENCFYILTPSPDVPDELNHRLVGMIEKIGAKVLFLDADTHDQIAAAVSHLPQMLSVCLVNFIEQYNRQQPNYLKLAAGGFRDMTRIACSPFYMWQDICQTNKENIIQALDTFIEILQSFKHNFESEFLQEQFEKAAKTRLSIPKDTKGFINPLFDISVVVEDKPGVIAEIANTLAQQNINIRDIEVLKVRLLEGGTLRLSFETEQNRNLAITSLQQKGFICQKR